jgi:hypothetical protein
MHDPTNVSIADTCRQQSRLIPLSNAVQEQIKPNGRLLGSVWCRRIGAPGDSLRDRVSRL